MFGELRYSRVVTVDEDGLGIGCGGGGLRSNPLPTPAPLQNMKIVILTLMLIFPGTVHAGPKKFLVKVAEHVTLGAGVEVGMSQIAGGPHKYVVGMTSAALVAGFKEGSDAHNGKDTKLQAGWHAFTIVAGAGIMAGIRH